MKNLKSKLPFIFYIMFIFALSVLALGFNFGVTSTALSVNEISANLLTEGTITFNGKTSDSLEFTEEYSATNYVLSLTGVSAESYNWYFAKDSSENYELLNGKNENSLQIKNCENSGKYVCSVTIGGEVKRTTPISINITKKDLTLNWQANKYFDYNGQDQKDDISVSYTGLQGETVTLPISITGYNSDFHKDYLNNTFIDCGTYIATAKLSKLEEGNYNILNPTATFYMQRVLPEVEIDKTEFTYTGEEQDVSEFVRLKNKEQGQELEFENNLFTTVAEGNNKRVYYTCAGSLNYLPLDRREQNSFVITVKKAVPVIDVSGVKKVYTYNGGTRKVDSGATINNNEQELNYTNNQFRTVAEGNGLIVKVIALESPNYTEASVSFSIKVEKAVIDSSDWKWNYKNPFTYDEAQTRTLFVSGFDEFKVLVEYENNQAKNAGSYIARAVFSLVDKDNYIIVGGTESMLPWQINKQIVARPIVGFFSTTYNGSEQSLNIKESSLYTISDNLQKNAGNYIVSVSLNDPKNYEWNNGNSNDLSIKWTVEKRKVPTPELNLDNYDGTEASINISANSPYYIIYSDERFILLGLADELNYAWEDSNRVFLRIDLGGGFFDSPALPIFVITLTVVTLILISVYFAVHSTIIIKRHRKKVALLKKRRAKKQITLTSSDNLAKGTNFTTNYEQPKEEKQKLQNNKQETTSKDLKTELNLKSEEKPVITENLVKENLVEENLVKETSVKEREVEFNEQEPNGTKKASPRGRKPKPKPESDKPKVRKPYTKSRKIENKKKVAQKKREITAKKVALKKEAEKKKTATKKAKAKSVTKKAPTRKSTSNK